MKICNRSWLGLGFAGLVLVGGGSAFGAEGITDKVTDAGKSVVSIIKKPFEKIGEVASGAKESVASNGAHGNSSGGIDLEARTSSDSYRRHSATAPSRSGVRRSYSAETSVATGGEASADYFRPEVKGSNANSPTSADVEYLNNPLDEAVSRLEAREKLEWDRLNHYEEKLQELSKLLNEYKSRHGATQKQLENTRRIRDMIRKNPSAINSFDGADSIVGSSQTTGDNGFTNELFSPSAAPSDTAWKDSGVDTFAPKVTEDFGATTDDVSSNRLAGPPMDNNASAESLVFGQRAPGSKASDSSLWGKKNEKEEADNAFTASVLVTDGSGDEATMIVGAGTKDGVKRGMTFSSGDGKDKTILVVTEAWPTYCRVIPHPKHSNREVHVRDRVTLNDDFSSFGK